MSTTKMKLTTKPFDPLVDDSLALARQVAKAVRKGKGRSRFPSATEIADSVEAIQVSDTIVGSSSLTVTLLDPKWELLESEVFDPSDTGVLGKVDLNFPVGSSMWWRLTQVNPSQLATAPRLELVFIERGAAYLQGHDNRAKVSRAKMTRAQFVRSLVLTVKAGGGLKFHSRQLAVKQKIAKPSRDASAADTSDSDNKSKGLEGVTFKSPAPPRSRKLVGEQRKLLEMALGVADDLGATTLAAKALICSGYGESEWSRSPFNSSGYGNILGGNKRWFTTSWEDAERQVNYFLKGGNGYQGGGAMALAKAHPDWPAGRIALVVEGSRSDFDSDAEAIEHYNKFGAMADDILDAWGGMSGGGGDSTTREYRKQYNFEVEAGETYWDACLRLAEEVRWALFIDGRNVYFDSEMELIKQKPTAVFKRGDADIIDLDGSWDARKIATEVTMTVVCQPFRFKAGQVVVLRNFGPLSTGSSAKPKALPGRWLIDSVERDHASLVSELTLRQPLGPKKEPAPEVGETDGDDDDTEGEEGVGTFEGVKVANWIIPILKYARSKGWNGKVNDGFRTYAEQKRIYDSGVRPAALPGTSNHEGSTFPRGAIDVDRASAPQLSRILLASKYKTKLVFAGAKDPVHFSHPHNGSY